MRTALASAAFALAIVAAGEACAQPLIPPSARAGRERQQLGDPLGPTVPRIELRDGRPAPVYETGRKAAKRKKCRTGKRC
jgi:hypothetical protein